MNLVELFVPPGALSEGTRQRIAKTITTELIQAPGAPADLIERGRAMTWVVVHEPAVWTVGDRAVGHDDAPRYVVRVTVPGGHLNEAMRSELVARVTRALAANDPDGDRVYRQPDAWIHIIETPDGNAGAFGRPMRTSEIAEFISTGMVSQPTAGETMATVLDPICGMTVRVTDDSLTLEHDGTRYAFCSASCRDIFARQADSSATTP